LSQEDVWGLVDEEVDVLGHEDVGIDSGLVTGSDLFEDLKAEVFGVGVGEVGETVETTEGDEVEGLGLLESFEAVGHEFRLVEGWGRPTHRMRQRRDEWGHGCSVLGECNPPIGHVSVNTSLL